MKTKRPMLVGVLSLIWLMPGSQAGLAQTSDLGPEILISVDGAPSMGDKNAKVTMIEFSDYQCPRSSEYFNWTMREIVKDYIKTGKVKYVYRDFPIESIHPLALKAAEGARCAGEQGKYWEMHDRFFRNQGSIGPEILPLHAGMLGLDVAKFQQCLDSGKYTDKVRESVADGEKAGVRGTPGFLLGRTEPGEPTIKGLVYIDGRQPYEVFKEAIDKLLSLPREEEKARSHE
jgi:protein-disulfide isomerase